MYHGALVSVFKLMKGDYSVRGLHAHSQGTGTVSPVAALLSYQESGCHGSSNRFTKVNENLQIDDAMRRQWPTAGWFRFSHLYVFVVDSLACHEHELHPHCPLRQTTEVARVLLLFSFEFRNSVYPCAAPLCADSLV